VPTIEQPDDITRLDQFEVNGGPVEKPDTEILEDYPDRCRRSRAPSPEPSSAIAFRNFQLKLRIFRILMRKAVG
jgi:hypothetical protein